jgi:hypothetical protein
VVVKAVPKPPEAFKPRICPLDNKPVLGLLRIVAVQMKFVGVLSLLRIYALGNIRFPVTSSRNSLSIFKFSHHYRSYCHYFITVFLLGIPGIGEFHKTPSCILG